MASDLERRLHRYRSTLDDAIADDLTERSAGAGAAPSRRRRAVVGAGAVMIAALGIGALAWTATNSSDRSDQSSARAATTDVGPTSTVLDVAPSTLDAPTTTTVPGDQRVAGIVERLAIGDNVMLGAAEQLAELGLVVDAAEARQFADVAGIVTSLRDAGRIGNVVVINSSTNGPIQLGDLDAVMSLLADVANVYMLTDAIDRSWSQPNNDLIESLIDRYSNVTVIDWATAAAACPGDCFYGDNVHLRPDGQTFYAQLIQDATSEPGTWTVDPDSVDASADRFTAAVVRLGCSNGQTSTVYTPTIMVSETAIVVTFRVAPLDRDVDDTCQDNEAVHVAVTLPEPIGQRRLVDGVCVHFDGAACESDAIRWNPDRTAESPGLVISNTIFPPPLAVAEPVDVPLAEMDAIGNNAIDRRTVALERDDDGVVLWWMTVWAESTASGADVYCTATRAHGHSCVPDANVQLRDPIQVSGFSMEAPSALTLIADAAVTSLRASIDDAEPIEVELVNVGVASGKKVAGLYLGDARNTVRFDATLVDGSSYTFAIKAPNVQSEPGDRSPGPASPNEPDAPKELLGE